MATEKDCVSELSPKSLCHNAGHQQVQLLRNAKPQQYLGGIAKECLLRAAYRSSTAVSGALSLYTSVL